MSSPEEIASKLTDHTQNVTYLHAASLALWIFENLITMNMEITYIWMTRWNVIKVVYIFVRYSTYIDLALNIIVECVPTLSAASCKSLCYAIILFLVIGLTAPDLILTLRVWAVWRTTRTMGIILVLVNIIFLTPIWISGGFLANSLKFSLQNGHLIREGCIASANVRFATAAWGVLLAYQTGQTS
ncbi:hypothetical protein BDQ17DRAFT_744993 [Cyathus striatus]|nr:hypothetical protein BDQ17DRAFT_744993 [Cyathus striatus]